MTNFQIIVLGLFIFLTIVGVAAFALNRSSSLGAASEIVWWGTIRQSALTPLITQVNKANGSTFKITYQEHNRDTIEAELVDALASGRGPDLILLPHTMIFSQAERLEIIPYASYPLADYNQTFLDLGRLFASGTGLKAIPLFVDPYVLYYDASRLQNALIVAPPKTWTQLIQNLPTLTKRDSRGTITANALALGEFSNIPHAKDLLTLLLLQAGNPIVEVGNSNSWRSVLTELRGYATAPSIFALNFFLQFADSNRSTYNWNSGLPAASEVFSEGLSAFYLGLASERPGLLERNPHQSLEVTEVPQRDGDKRLTFAHLYGLAIPRQSTKKAAALRAAYALTATDTSRAVSALIGLPPARRDLLAKPPTGDSVQSSFYRSAIVSAAWFDPAPHETETIFRRMAEAAKVGRLTQAEAVNQAGQELSAPLARLHD